jgi:hypothetical protein
VLILLSLVLLLVGGGFGPPLLGAILGIAATRIDSPLAWWRAHVPKGARRFLGTLWPWSFVASLIAWLFLCPGSLLLDYSVGLNPDIMYVVPPAAFGLLLLTIFTGLARDTLRQTGT